MKEGLAIYRNKKVLVTGHTGFKGSWLSIWLNELGAKVIGYALDPYSKKDNFARSNVTDEIVDIRGDIRDFNRLNSTFKEHSPDIVFHLAAQALVIDGYNYPKDTYDVNVGGTVNVLESCRLSDSVRVIVNVTSDKCYENKEWLWGYRENDRLGGKDPYSSSKACCELVAKAYQASFFQVAPGNVGKVLSSVRAGNAIGGGDWRMNRIIPDCIRSLEKGQTIKIRNPGSTRPWQFVLEPLGGYLLLGARMHENNEKYQGVWNFGPMQSSITTVQELVTLLLERYGKGSWEESPDRDRVRETTYLSLDTNKVRATLGWHHCYSIQEAVGKTVDWYKAYPSTRNMYDFCRNQISEYMEAWSHHENH